GTLAAEHVVHPGKRRGARLLPRLAENGRVLQLSQRAIAEASRQTRSISPAAEWLLNNFHVVEEQIREIQEDLPPGFYRELPKLASGDLADYPRVYGLAWAFVAHTDSRVELETLRRFVRAYQAVQPLTIGELWALAISLRLVLVENLRRLAEGVIARGIARDHADAVADAQLGDADTPRPEPAAMIQMLEQRPFTKAFAVQLARRLREQDPAVTPALPWLDRRLAREGTTADEAVHIEHQAQIATHATVRNVITSMRLLSSVRWADFFESVSLVHEALCDGSRVAEMDFPTRDRYRRAVEELSRGCAHDEVEVARRAVLMAQEAGSSSAALDPGVEPRLMDPGYYLISKGRPPLEADLGYRVPARQWLRRAWFRAATPLYLSSIGLWTIAILGVPVSLAAAAGASPAVLALLTLLALVPASDLASSLVQRFATELVGPRRLPKLELAEGVPEGSRALVAIPMLLTDEAEIREAVQRLEVHYLANTDAQLRFALLSDWSDAPAESMPDDQPLLDIARAAIGELNQEHGSAGGGGDRFWVFHRRRLWNPSEGEWMGWERKRGKLRELNRLLRGATDTSFLPQDNGAAPPAGIRYVLTLDADTRLPREAVRQLVGTISHPLNLSIFDAAAQRVVDGHAILQPRVTPTLAETGWGSLFQLIFSGPRGIDPYAFAVSDVYQDLFGEGIFTGKGIYDVDVFERALGDRVPENTQLSHDLFEGLFARAGLVSDVELFEGFPGHYEVAASRQNRWVRGDWQLLPWIAGRDPRGDGARSAIPVMGRWKMIDNLRRSLSAPAMLATLLAGWCLPRAGPRLWTLFVLAILTLPTLLSFLTNLFPSRRGIAKRSFLRGVAADLAVGLAQSGLRIVFLAHTAWLRTDAIVRTLWRLAVTRRHLLEWVPAAQAHRALDLKLSGFHRRMGSATVVAAAAGLLVAAAGERPWPWAAPFVAAWLLSPLIAWWVSLPPREVAGPSISDEQARAFRRIARRTWRFFERFTGPESHGLPSDNFQETPQPEVARRTSPTNVGLALLSTVAASDFGWIGTGEMLERLEAAFSTLGKLERYRGHFFNWYDTETLQPLEPRYVSTVDSGNLAAHLVTLRNVCFERVDEPAAIEWSLAGIADALEILRESAATVSGRERGRVVTSRQIEEAVAETAALLSPVPTSREEWAKRLAALTTHAETLVDIGLALVQEGEGPEAGPVLEWALAVRACVRSHAADAAWMGAAGSESVFAQRLGAIAATAGRLAQEMDFTFLYDSARELFSLGYRMSDGTLDPGHYDLLASEARLASFVAIAFGEAPVEHWFHLGRPLTPVGRGSALMSWSGSMFEYLMPDLVLEAPDGSLLKQTNRLAVRRQIAYAAEHGVPWGTSEAAYNARDLRFTYQYSNFGLSGLGLKRGLSDDLVVAPYATALAAMVEPVAALQNFERLASIGALGEYGFYESIDYTPSRVPEGSEFAIVRAFMAHHQGMTIVALANVVLGSVMCRRFRAEPAVQATELLLQERTPRTVAVARPVSEGEPRLHVRDEIPPVLRRFRSPHDPTPRTHLLSNGGYSVMMTAAGSGYSRWRGLDVTRWREDTTRDPWGTFVFLSDGESGQTWSAGYQPAGVEPDRYDAIYSEDRVEIHRRDGVIATSMRVVVSTEDDAEMRQISLTNFGVRTREIDITSYAEIVLAAPGADAAHPAFSNLFVQTQFVPAVEALLARRRPRDREQPVWAAHVMTVHGELVGLLQYDTDRARFVGRGRTIRNPSAIEERRPLSNTVGTVLDPIFSIRRRLRLPPGATARVQLALMAADTREQALALADKYRDPATFERISDLAWTQAQVQLRHLGISTDEAHLFQRVATRILYSDPTLRAPVETLIRNRRGPSALWAHAISGDLPIVLIRIDQVDEQGIVRQLLRAHEYWRLKGLAVDLVIIDESAASYSPDLGPALDSLVRAGARAFGAPTEPGKGE
ncbi:MAG TPA: glucoamylase family protein, partial [Thermoanaerobaculia bacterium]